MTSTFSQSVGILIEVFVKYSECSGKKVLENAMLLLLAGHGKVCENIIKSRLGKFEPLARVCMAIWCPYDQLFCLRCHWWVHEEARVSGNCEARRALAGRKLSLMRLLAAGTGVACVSRRLIIRTV